MERFYFDFYDDEVEVGHDTEGTELPDAPAALKEARMSLAELTKDVLSSSGPRRILQIKVRDGDGEPVLMCSVVFEAHSIRPAS
jgi:hypothetical protein